MLTSHPSGTYFNCIMFMVASSVVTTIMILNYHHRLADTHEMPGWVSGNLFCVFQTVFYLVTQLMIVAPYPCICKKKKLNWNQKYR